MAVCTPSCQVLGSTLTLSGELDLATAADLEAALATALAALADSGQPELIVDLGATTFLDSVTIRALVRARRRAEAAGGRLRLRGVSPRIGRVLRLFDPGPPFEVMD